MQNDLQWPLTKKIGFRFLSIYLILFCVPSPLWTGLVAAAGRFLGMDAHFRQTGSGDSTFHYVQVLCSSLMALLGTIVWSVADRKRAHYRNLYLGLRVFARLFLGAVLIQYGAVKIIQAQFPPPNLHRLQETFGDASPMGLLWTFMGASGPYNVFTGAAEMLGGILLFFPRTALAGSLISIAVITQICALNFCYDVPVKLFSLHLLAIGIFLAAKDARRLLNFFVMNRAAQPASFETVLQRPLLLLAAFSGNALYTARLQQIRTMALRSNVDPAKFPLLNRGFHWINEYPYNR